MRRNKPYWLADLIYPKWPIFFHTCSDPVTEKEKLLAREQEGARKDVERAFGVLQAKWHIVTLPARFWSVETMARVLRCVIILHNMMVEDRDDYAVVEDSDNAFIIGEGVNPMWAGGASTESSAVTQADGSIAAMCATNSLMKDRQEYALTRRLVMEHLWSKRGDQH